LSFAEFSLFISFLSAFVVVRQVCFNKLLSGTYLSGTIQALAEGDVLS